MSQSQPINPNNSANRYNKPKAAAESVRLNQAQRYTVRVALATGATVAALIGAQTLAILDRSDPTLAAAPDVANTASGGDPSTLEPVLLSNAGLQPTVVQPTDAPASAIPSGTALPSTIPPTKAVVVAQATVIQPTVVRPTATPSPTARPTVRPTVYVAPVQPTPRTKSTHRK